MENAKSRKCARAFDFCSSDGWKQGLPELDMDNRWIWGTI
jgi:hypothetical protein